MDGGLYVASVVWHGGEEPVLGGGRGVCNIFFPHCTLRCLYCQNCQISANELPICQMSVDLEGLVARVEGVLARGVHTVGFVSATSYAQWIPPIVNALRERGFRGSFLYNTNAYDTPETIDALAGYIDIYLPDYKYGSYSLAALLSGARDYPDRALESIARMGQQVGWELQCDETGAARSGVIVRHLVLPGQLENSRAALINLRTEFGRDLYLSLLSQYTPCGEALTHPRCAELGLQRKLTAQEYDGVVRFAYELGFSHGWLQELCSAEAWLPDFSRDGVFLETPQGESGE